MQASLLGMELSLNVGGKNMRRTSITILFMLQSLLCTSCACDAIAHMGVKWKTSCDYDEAGEHQHASFYPLILSLLAENFLARS